MQGLYLSSKLELVVTSEVSNVHLSTEIRRLDVWFLVMNIWRDPCYRPFPRLGAMTKADSENAFAKRERHDLQRRPPPRGLIGRDLFLITSTPGLQKKPR
jgi:hypothetical protein